MPTVETQKAQSGRNKYPLSLFFHSPISLGFPIREPGWRSEGKVTVHEGQSPGYRESGRVESESGGAKRGSGTANKRDLARVSGKEFLDSSYRKITTVKQLYIMYMSYHSVTHCVSLLIAFLSNK